MAPPKWRKEVMDCFVDECYNMVKDGCQQTNESVFFARLEKNMQLCFVDVPLGKADLNKQFKRLNHLWGQYHHDLHDWMLRRVCTPPEHFTIFLRL